VGGKKAVTQAAQVLFLFDQPGFTLSEEDELLADLITSYWANFAETGVPSHFPLAEWQPYSAEYKVPPAPTPAR
jgi:carboxylesterase type B